MTLLYLYFANMLTSKKFYNFHFNKKAYRAELSPSFFNGSNLTQVQPVSKLVKFIDDKHSSIKVDKHVYKSQKKDKAFIEWILTPCYLKMTPPQFHKENYAVIMKRIQGEDLASFRNQINKEKKYPISKVMNIIGWSLYQLYEQIYLNGIVHRDVKLDNIIVFFLEGKAPLLNFIDFGLAKPKINQDEYNSGTKNYLAPEMRSKKFKSTYKTDIFSLGMTFFYLLKGTQFANQFSEPNLRTITGEIPTNLRNGLISLLQGMLNKDPKIRFNLEMCQSLFLELCQLKDCEDLEIYIPNFIQDIHQKQVDKEYRKCFEIINSIRVNLFLNAHLRNEEFDRIEQDVNIIKPKITRSSSVQELKELLQQLPQLQEDFSICTFEEEEEEEESHCSP
jgi:serine/threonine protein kinase